MRSPPRQQVSLGPEQRGGRQSSSSRRAPAQHRTRLRAMLPAWSPAGFWRQCSPPCSSGTSSAPDPAPGFPQPHPSRLYPWRRQRQPRALPPSPNSSAREGLTVPPAAAAPAEVPVPCSMLPGSPGTLLCAGAAALPGSGRNSETEHALPSLLGQGREKKPREQRQKCCQLRLETQLHPKSKARCTWRSVTWSRLGKEQHEEGPR